MRRFTGISAKSATRGIFAATPALLDRLTGIINHRNGTIMALGTADKGGTYPIADDDKDKFKMWNCVEFEASEVDGNRSVSDVKPAKNELGTVAMHTRSGLTVVRNEEGNATYAVSGVAAADSLLNRKLAKGVKVRFVPSKFDDLNVCVVTDMLRAPRFAELVSYNKQKRFAILKWTNSESGVVESAFAPAKELHIVGPERGMIVNFEGANAVSEDGKLPTATNITLARLPRDSNQGNNNNNRNQGNNRNNNNNRNNRNRDNSENKKEKKEASEKVDDANLFQ